MAVSADQHGYKFQGQHVKLVHLCTMKRVFDAEQVIHHFRVALQAALQLGYVQYHGRL